MTRAAHLSPRRAPLAPPVPPVPARGARTCTTFRYRSTLIAPPVPPVPAVLRYMRPHGKHLAGRVSVETPGGRRALPLHSAAYYARLFLTLRRSWLVNVVVFRETRAPAGAQELRNAATSSTLRYGSSKGGTYGSAGPLGSTLVGNRDSTTHEMCTNSLRAGCGEKRPRNTAPAAARTINGRINRSRPPCARTTGPEWPATAAAARGCRL